MAQVLSSPPSDLSVFSRALLSLAKRPTHTEVPEAALTLLEARSDDAKLAAYGAVCGFAASPYFLPSTVSYREQRLGNGARFETRDERGEKPHVRGLVELG